MPRLLSGREPASIVEADYISRQVARQGTSGSRRRLHRLLRRQAPTSHPGRLGGPAARLEPRPGRPAALRHSARGHGSSLENSEALPTQTPNPAPNDPPPPLRSRLHHKKIRETEG